jgi:hypothetical protein
VDLDSTPHYANKKNKKTRKIKFDTRDDCEFAFNGRIIFLT